MARRCLLGGDGDPGSSPWAPSEPRGVVGCGTRSSLMGGSPDVPGPSVFFNLGQRSLTHCSMASSSRSAAWRTGRCRSDPSGGAPSTRVRDVLHPVVCPITSALGRSPPTGEPARTSTCRSSSAVAPGRRHSTFHWSASRSTTGRALVMDGTTSLRAILGRRPRRRAGRPRRVGATALGGRPGRALFVAAPAGDVEVGIRKLLHSTSSSGYSAPVVSHLRLLLSGGGARRRGSNRGSWASRQKRRRRRSSTLSAGSPTTLGLMASFCNTPRPPTSTSVRHSRPLHPIRTSTGSRCARSRRWRSVVPGSPRARRQ